MPLSEILIWYCVFLFSTTLHEASHAWTALRFGDPTAYLGGQVSLDPRPHIQREPVGMVVLPLLSLFLMGWPFGYASAPYDPVWASRNHKKAAWMALAGPASNLLLVIIAMIFIRIAVNFGIFTFPESFSFSSIVLASNSNYSTAALFISIFFSLNLLLAVLNCLPLPPLDGSEIISLFLKPSQAMKYQAFINNPAYSLMGLFIAWQIFPKIFFFCFDKTLNILLIGT